MFPNRPTTLSPIGRGFKHEIINQKIYKPGSVCSANAMQTKVPQESILRSLSAAKAKQDDHSSGMLVAKHLERPTRTTGVEMRLSQLRNL